MKYKNYIFDMGKVLIDYDCRIVCRQKTDNEKMIYDAVNIVFCSYEWALLDAGVVSLDYAWSQIAKRINDPVLYEICKYAFFNWEKVALRPIYEMEEVIKTIKENGSNAYILSNISEPILNVDKQLIPAYNLFDGIFYSFQHACIKPQNIIYEKMLKEFNIKAEDSFFIDDLEVNVLAAKKIGIDAYQHKNLDVKKLKEVLEI